MPSWYHIPPQLRDIAEKVAQGERPNVSARTLLSWFYARYRTKDKIREIDWALETLKLRTEPHFNWTWLDGQVAFVAALEKSPADAPKPAQDQKTLEDSLQQSDSVAAALETHIDPTYRIGRLEIANRTPVSIAPDSTIKQAVTLMLMHDFSQLPVMTSEREVKGIFSWKSLGSRASQGAACSFVHEAMERHCEVGADASLFDGIKLIQEHDCILIRDATTRKITGIMTPFDISVTFGQLAEPFLALGEIENHIRNLIRGKITSEELAAARDPGDTSRKIQGVDDLTFGEYMRLLENPSHWEKLRLEIDRVLFVKDLDEVRRIRNDVMHFDPEGTDEADLTRLRRFAEFLRRLERLRAK